MRQAPVDGDVRIVIADDHELVRFGLRTLLEAQPGFEVVGEAADGSSVVEVAGETEPHVILLDINMPDVDGVEACRRIKEAHPEICVLMLSSFDGEAEVAGAMSGGASGYVMKDIAPEELMETVRAVAHGRTVLDPGVAKTLFAEKPAAVEPDTAGLSKRELEVLHLMASGHSNKEIARELWVSEPTVKTHVSSVIRKLGQRDRTQAVLAALRLGVIDVGEQRSVEG